MPAKKLSISLPEDLYQEAIDRAETLGYDTFSEYIQFLFQEDCENQPVHTTVREPGKIKYTARATPPKKQTRTKK